ncbi:hypothetical protein KXV25_002543 [Aspergillus fumigatus]|nr:hypothetical protein KXW69_006392 [Aspergillus fumigatus]KAH2547770.1 hypothetical protein KXW12_005587 [Aspergillus fumigatus]KAH2583905.1 hypothetical protein KXV99_007284 [Aspergillus fumigatus]KAH2997594.1 hypothetical protein KXV25_002543 [Aspergillus fumigatus]KAH3331252.1 hypothetical protein KXW13_006517 [Aspergillus fumigatus]
MSKESTDPNAIELLSRLATLLEEVANNLHHNRLDRTAVQTLLHQYSSRAKSDGHLINASKQDSQCVEHGVFLSYVHVELLSWLTKHNYTVPASSVKWYSWRKLSSRKYRLPSLFSSRAHAAQLEDLLRNVVAKAELLQAELRAHELEIPDVAVDYERVSPQAPQGTPPEGTGRHPSATSHIRIARPCRDFTAAERFYVDGLGLKGLWRSGPAHEVEGGHELLMLGWPGAAWHLELVLMHGNDEANAPKPTEEDLLVIYVDGAIEPGVVERLVENGGTRVQHPNEYWEKWGVTIKDPDGYLLVLCQRGWTNV